MKCEICKTDVADLLKVCGWCADIPKDKLAEAYARGRVDGANAERDASRAVYESREEWAKRTSELETALMRYGCHEVSCNRVKCGNQSDACDCGFTKALTK